MTENHKIKRDIRAFRNRIRMSPKRLWLLVEGKAHDRTFYENVVESSTSLPSSRYEVRLGEQVTVDGVSAGGKPHLLKVFRIFQENDWLEQSNRRGKVTVVFCLDKDVDDFQGRVVSNDHVLYTKNADVEAEILHYSDVPRAISFSHGIGYSAAKKILAGDNSVPERLMAVWENWIRLRLLAIACGYSGSGRFGQPSVVNRNYYEEFDSAAEEAIRSEIKSCTSEEVWRNATYEVDEFINRLKTEGSFSSLISGKQVSSYVVYLTKKAISDVIIRSKITPQEITISCFARLDFDGRWVEHYRFQLNRALRVSTQRDHRRMTIDHSVQQSENVDRLGSS
ncbi:hypothetical protein ACFVKB_01890 [Rhodococcus sp. NPDC127530]|uniref:hypothetical protein n=1 Tax=unclassified Rhodococcus (in: high G+C Gram-positive bacteria) TaxID=192944 RepID=UPI00363F28BB